MATITIVNDFKEDLGLGLHQFETHVLGLAFSNTAPASETSNPTLDTNGVLANVTQVVYTNYSDDLTTDRQFATTEYVWSLSSGTATLNCNDVVVTATASSFGPFQYVYLYNVTAAGNPLIAVWDHGSAITLANAESVTIDFNQDGGANGTVFTLA